MTPKYNKTKRKESVLSLSSLHFSSISSTEGFELQFEQNTGCPSRLLIWPVPQVSLYGNDYADPHSSLTSYTERVENI